jgi:hypothetical protein
VANSLKEDSSFRAVRLDALSYGQQLLHKEFKNLGLTDNWEGLQVSHLLTHSLTYLLTYLLTQVGVSQKNNTVTAAAAENIVTDAAAENIVTAAAAENIETAAAAENIETGTD